MAKNIELVIRSRERDLGGFSVRRLLPYATHRMVGPFIFFDHMGPAEMPPGHGMDVRPHPHIGLATVTYLFDGCIEHRDSLGNDALIEPGAVNWMTAGRGIVHSERTPPKVRASGTKMNGIQCWVALPREHEETEPAFHHHPANSLPEFEVEGVKLKLLLGRAFGKQSPVKIHSDLFYLEAKFTPGAILTMPNDRETAVYVVDGELTIDGEQIGPQTMVVAKNGCSLKIEAQTEARLMLLGGANIGPRFIFWNLVSTSEERLQEAKKDWAPGPRKDSGRFQPIPGDDSEFIPLPEEPPRNPKGTIM